MTASDNLSNANLIYPNFTMTAQIFCEYFFTDYVFFQYYSAATMKKVLTDSGLGSSVIGGGLSDELMQATWSIGLKGVAPEKVSFSYEKIIISMNVM